MGNYMDPNFRTLRQVTIDSLAEADRVFSMLMGDEVPPEFIERKFTRNRCSICKN
jgi:DNA gyrase subunit B